MQKDLPIPYWNYLTENKPLNFPFIRYEKRRGHPERSYFHVIQREVFSSFIPYVVTDPEHCTTAQNSLRFVCISDTHALHRDISVRCSSFFR